MRLCVQCAVCVACVCARAGVQLPSAHRRAPRTQADEAATRERAASESAARRGATGAAAAAEVGTDARTPSDGSADAAAGGGGGGGDSRSRSAASAAAGDSGVRAAANSAAASSSVDTKRGAAGASGGGGGGGGGGSERGGVASMIERGIITARERELVPEYFDGSAPSKTPQRYVMIRDHIEEVWREMRPNYITRTRARKGLVGAGDVNAVARVFAALEQMGRINVDASKCVAISIFFARSAAVFGAQISIALRSPLHSRRSMSMIFFFFFWFLVFFFFVCGFCRFAALCD